MPLSAGTRIGPYEVVTAIGSGGMGDVYRARDTRLGREVAIKALSGDAELDAERLARFQREAQILAALNHPHIAAIYGVEEATLADRAAPSRFLILELVSGGTLADRIARGPLPAREALKIARELADALQAAHDRGIIHRDLKPGNVALTPDGQVKVLDFGIAKMREARDGDAATMTRDMTEHGVVIGTAAYMSPEQARGLPLDKRTDIWSFGCVLFEALTGASPFRAATASDTIAGILSRDPDFSNLPANTPPRIVWLLRRCLDKDTRRRLHDIADARIEIEEALAPDQSGSDAAAIAPPRRPPVVRERLAWIAAGVATIAGVVAWAMLLSGRTPSPSEGGVVVRSAVMLPANVRLLVGEEPSARFAISPDGRRLAIVAASGAEDQRLYVRPMDGVVPQPLAGTEGASHPFWSPDSQSIAFIARPASSAQLIAGKLKRIDLDTGQVTTLGDVLLSASATWNADGVILFTPRGTGPIHRIAASGGASAPVTVLDEANGDVQHAHPFFLPDGNHFLFSVIGSRTAGATASRGVFVTSLDGRTPPALVVEGASGAKYANGHVLFVRAGRLMALPFDAARLRSTGDPRLVAEGLQEGGGSGGGTVGAFSVSASGVMAYQAVVPVRMQLAWFDRSGTRRSLLGGEADYADVTLSRDGARAAVSVLDPLAGSRDIWVYDTARNLRERVTSDPADDFAPVWSPRGDRLVFSSARQGRVDLFVVPSTAPGQEAPVPVASLDVGKFAATWSPRDDLLVFIAGGRVIARSDLWAVGVNGNREPFAVVQSPAVETQARFSPDGRWLAYVTNESSQLQVYVQPFPGPGSRQRISVDGGRYPQWRHDGSEIFYLGPDNRLMAASVRLTDTEAQVGAIQPLFPFQFHRVRLDAYPYDVAPDGRFLVNTLIEESAPAAISLLINWPAAVAR